MIGLGTPLASGPPAMKISPTGVHSRVPTLRLVNAEGSFEASVMRASHGLRDAATVADPDRDERAARRAKLVAAENSSAMGLSALDPRWIFAVQVAKSLDGGRAAILIPERRRALVADAARLGLRAFDANLLIAIVQDGVRTGEGGLGHESESRLKLVRPASRVSRMSEATARLVVTGVTAVLSMGLFFMALAWLRG